MIRQIVTNNKTRFFLFTATLFLFSFILGVHFAIPLFLLSLVAYLLLRAPGLKTPRLLYLSFIFVIIFVSGYYMVKQGWSLFFVPFIAAGMLTTLLFNQLELSLLISLAASLSVTSISGNNLYLGVLFFIGTLISSIMVLGARRRIAIIRAGFVVGILQAIVLFSLDGFRIILPYRYTIIIINGVASSGIVMLLLPIFEYLFNTVTNISLLELADFNHPILQRMVLEAPGTYHHSLIVGNISEAACRATGANALLARIGAYYHDIGKIEKAEYFSENQSLLENKHDVLSPAMSKLVIMNHVKEGVELAKRHKINPRLIDFIQQHHGTSLVYYFYRRALEGLEDEQGITEEGYRYPGPKPDTKEAAIVLLADSVEAATRALRDPAPKKIEEVVHKIINNKFIDGQLDECDLTLKDLEKISKVFVHILSGIYHTRIAYPENSGA